MPHPDIFSELCAAPDPLPEPAPAPPVCDCGDCPDCRYRSLDDGDEWYDHDLGERVVVRICAHCGELVPERDAVRVLRCAWCSVDCLIADESNGGAWARVLYALRLRRAVRLVASWPLLEQALPSLAASDADYQTMRAKIAARARGDL